jgi:hypothetical protein
VSAQPGAVTQEHLEYPAALVAPGRWEARTPQFEADLLARLAGPAAERAILGDADTAAEAADERIVLDALLAKGRGGEQANQGLGELRAVAVAFVAEVAPVIRLCAEYLSERDRVTGVELAAWVKRQISSGTGVG